MQLRATASYVHTCRAQVPELHLHISCAKCVIEYCHLDNGLRGTFLHRITNPRQGPEGRVFVTFLVLPFEKFCSPLLGPVSVLYKLFDLFLHF